jgi:hypothetical protein
MTLMSKEINLNTILLLSGMCVASFVGYKVYQGLNVVSKATDKASKDFWSWYYDLENRPEFVQDFDFIMLERQFFDDSWKISEEAYVTYNNAYPDVMRKLFGFGRILPIEYRNLIK